MGLQFTRCALFLLALSLFAFGEEGHLSIPAYFLPPSLEPKPESASPLEEKVEEPSMPQDNDQPAVSESSPNAEVVHPTAKKISCRQAPILPRRPGKEAGATAKPIKKVAYASNFYSLCYGWQPCKLCLCPSYTAGKGVGYRTGYGSIGFWANGWRSAEHSFQPFIDLRGHFLENGEKAANFGLGGRCFIDLLDTVFGFNIYYDYREGKKKTHFNQIGVGAEIVGSSWNFFINGYMPIGKRQTRICKEYQTLRWDGLIHCKKERSLSGFDAELGYYFKQRDAASRCDFDLYAGIGPYYFSANHGSTIFGGLLRCKAIWLDCINLEVVATSDNVYHQLLQARVELCIPLGASCWKDEGYPSGACRWARDACSPRLQRREIIAVRNTRKLHCPN